MPVLHLVAHPSTSLASKASAKWLAAPRCAGGKQFCPHDTIRVSQSLICEVTIPQGQMYVPVNDGHRFVTMSTGANISCILGY